MHKLNYEITKDTKMDWIMYLVGGLDRSVVISVDTGPSIGRYIGRVSVDISVEYRPKLSVVYRSTLGYISVDCRFSVDTRSIIDRCSINILLA